MALYAASFLFLIICQISLLIRWHNRWQASTPSALVWISSYQLGLFLNLKYSKIGWKKRLMLHVQTLLLCPIIGLVETFPAFWATLEYCFKKRNAAEKTPVYDFYVISK